MNSAKQELDNYNNLSSEEKDPAMEESLRINYESAKEDIILQYQNLMIIQI